MRIVLAAQAAISFAVGCFITFTQQLHTPALGLMALVWFAALYSVATAIGSVVFTKGLVAIENIPLAVIAAVIAILAGLNLSSNKDLLAGFVSLVTIWSLLTAAFELYLARRAGFSTAAGRDRSISSGLSFLLGLIFLLAPLGESKNALGFFGAYLVLSAVHLAITAATPVSPAEPKS